jgi:hypothetical protein
VRKDPIDVRSFSMDSSREGGVVVLAGVVGGTGALLDDAINS